MQKAELYGCQLQATQQDILTSVITTARQMQNYVGPTTKAC